MDWNAIKTEYITTDTSYRKLAAKYNVPLANLYRRGKKEHWVELKQQSEDKAIAKTVDEMGKKQAARATKIIDISNKLLSKFEESVETLDPNDRQGFRQLTAALKDIKDIQMIKSEADIREQEARIKNLQRQAEQEDTSHEVSITIEGGDASWRR